MKLISLFAGIGGFDLAAEKVGWKTIAWCEWNEFGQIIMGNYWPEAKKHGDITKTDFNVYRGSCDIITGGFPCQPFSLAGERKGTEDDRHLWPEMLRAVREAKPRWVVGENVFGIVNWSGGLVFEQVQADLEAEGYEVQAYVLPAAGVNAPHRRDRTWFVAYSSDTGSESLRRSGENSVHGFGAFTDSGLQRQKKRRFQAMGAIKLRKEQVIANAESGRSGRIRHQSKKAGTRKSDITFRSISGISFTSNPSNKRSQGGQFYGTFAPRRIERKRSSKGQPYKSVAQLHKNSDWQFFPTQSPVCNGNDGIPARLVRDRIRADSMGILSEKEIDIIFSKAAAKIRNESIKAGGNAIVPQVALQIFKAIQQYENLKTHPS